MNGIRLKRQLRAQVVSRQEADTLVVLANNLRRTSLPHLSQDVKNDIAEQLGIHPRRYRIARRLSLATSFVVMALLVISIQTATPKSHLYDIKSTVNKFVPWSHQMPASRQSFTSSSRLPVQSAPVPVPSTDNKTTTQSPHATGTPERQEHDSSNMMQSYQSSQQHSESNNDNTKKMFEELHDILSRQPHYQVNGRGGSNLLQGGNEK